MKELRDTLIEILEESKEFHTLKRDNTELRLEVKRLKSEIRREKRKKKK